MASKRTKEGFGVQFKRKKRNERVNSLLAVHHRAPSRVSVSGLGSRSVINVINPNLSAIFETVNTDSTSQAIEYPDLNYHVNHYRNQTETSLQVLESLDNTSHPSFARKLAS